jgi:N-acyl-D-amino-acid deacylase
VHTHYGGQATWGPWLTHSSWHGVTIAVMGNCGVGFAPAGPQGRDRLIGLMEGVEDIPGAALSEGIRRQWETFPEYLDALWRTPLAIDVGAQEPHGALRVWVIRARPDMIRAATRPRRGRYPTFHRRRLGEFPRPGRRSRTCERCMVERTGRSIRHLPVM